MDVRLKNVLFGAVAGYFLKYLWTSLGLQEKTGSPVIAGRFGGEWIVAGIVVLCGVFSQFIPRVSRAWMWFGFGMLGGLFVREQTAGA